MLLLEIHIERLQVRLRVAGFDVDRMDHLECMAADRLVRALEVADAALIDAYWHAAFYRIKPQWHGLLRSHDVLRGSWQVACPRW